MPDIPFVDSHVHFWDLNHPTLVYTWLLKEDVHPVLGDVRPIRQERYAGDEFAKEIRFANVSKVVHVWCGDFAGSADPVDETRWLEDEARRTGLPHAIIAFADLRDPKVETVLEGHATASQRVCGVRSEYMPRDAESDQAFVRGYRSLEKFALVANLGCRWEDMTTVRDLAGSFEATTILLDHAGHPHPRDPAYLEHWRHGLTIAAERENVWCKISGFGFRDHDWTLDSIRPLVLHCIETFGVERCVMGSDWPVHKLYSSYDALLAAFAEIISDFSADEQLALFSKNAERLFRI
jgi:predicted TIM-barrel fold metal-dependent hydrolase